MDNSNQLVLGYWPIRGLAQPLRFFLNYVGLQFQEKRYATRDEWCNIDKPAFASKLANLPYLRDGQHTQFESDSIYYYIANKVNRQDLVGKDLATQTNVAVVRSLNKDVNTLLMAWVYDKANAEARKAKMLENLTIKLAIFEEILEKSQWITGDVITYPDFQLAESTDHIRAIDQATIDQFKNLLSHRARFLEIPQNKAYTQHADYIERPYNNLQHGAIL